MDMKKQSADVGVHGPWIKKYRQFGWSFGTKNIMNMLWVELCVPQIHMLKS